MLLAINRYMHVSKPALCRATFTEKRSITMVVGAWIVSIPSTIVLFYVSGIQFQTLDYQPSFCLWEYSDTSGTLIVTVGQMILIVVPNAVIIVCYVKIYRTIRQHNANVAPSTQGGGPSALGVEEAKMTRILTAVVIGYNICWMPVCISNISTAIGVVVETAFDTLKYVNFYFTFPVFTSSIINPVIYASMSQAFRKEFLKVFQC